MRPDKRSKKGRRLTLRLTKKLWKRLRIEGRYRDASATQLINEYLDAGLSEIEWYRKAGANHVCDKLTRGGVTIADAKFMRRMKRAKTEAKA